MICPVRCFSCGQVVADKYEAYKKLIDDGKSPEQALDLLGVKKYCCRRMLLTHVELIDEVIKF
jgi:DNA-directed RNA polymerase subunit N (RpoN/RPB10)